MDIHSRVSAELRIEYMSWALCRKDLSDTGCYAYICLCYDSTL